MIYIIMGVSGSGKSTVGRLLAERLTLPFYDGDDFHPASNVEKMSSGKPLNDHDRKPWLESLAHAMQDWESSGGAVLACSALKEKYRDILRASNRSCSWIMLEGSRDLIAERLSKRPDHFFDDNLLTSQFDTLEPAPYARHFDVSESPGHIVQRITEHMHTDTTQDIGVIGLGVMGRNLVLNFADNGIPISAFNRHVQGLEENVAKDFVASNASFNNILPFDDLNAFVLSLKRPRNILIMVKAGKPVDGVIEKLLPLLESGDCIIDGGNSHYSDTDRRVRQAEKAGIAYIGMGVSGGEMGARFGPSMMPGGSPEVVEKTLPLLQTIAAKDKDGNPCCEYIGPAGSGHFVKMVHNGIEYAEMQLIAECYDVLSKMLELDDQSIANVFEIWQQGSNESYLLEITIDILRKNDSDGTPLLPKIADMASHKGTGSWSVQAGLDLHTPVPSMAAALEARQYSSLKSTRVEAGEGLRRRPEGFPPPNVDFTAIVRSAYSVARVINHIIGFELIKSAATTYEWELNMSALARIWTNGCIIRSRLMYSFIDILNTSDGKHLLLDDRLPTRNDDTARLDSIVGTSTLRGMSLPVMHACTTYVHSMRTARSSANLIAAQRDFFGAHGYRLDGDDSDTQYHADWQT